MNRARSGNISPASGDLVSKSADRTSTPQQGNIRFMTNLGDVVRQVETALCDTYYPPTLCEREIYNRILQTVFTGAVDAKGSR